MENVTPPVVSEALRERRERVFITLAAFFLCAMTLLNVVGITRFIQLGPLALAVGVLPYPLTFLCTDLICELYGHRRANFLVTLGLFLNGFIILFLYLGQLAPAVGPEALPPWQAIQLAESLSLPNGQTVSGTIELFTLVYACTSGAVYASMVAYMAAQYCDVKLFHFWKRLTKGRYLWVRNNFSTLISQMVDSVAVVGVTFGATWLAGAITTETLLTLIGSNYAFKAVCAAIDTGPFYLLVARLKRYLEIDNLAVD